MKHFIISLAYFILYLKPVSAQETYTHYFAVYGIGNDMIEVMVCQTEPYQYVSDKVTGMNGITLVPEAKFRRWIMGRYGNKISQSAFYPAVSAEQAINYYKDHVATYQQSKSKYQNSSYCTSIFSIPYVEPAKKPTSNTSTNNTARSIYNSSQSTPSDNSTSNSNSSTNESASQRQYRVQQERVAETKRQSEAQSKELVEGTTELVGMVGNMLASNRADREKKQAKKEAARVFAAEQKAKEVEAAADRKSTIEYYLKDEENMNIDRMQRLYVLYHHENNFVESKKWLKKATNALEVRLQATGDSSILETLATSNKYYEGDFNDALKWMIRAANYFDKLEYISSVGQFYYNGGFDWRTGAKGNVNASQAIYWLTKAADRGNQTSMGLLTNIYDGSPRYQYGLFKPYKDKKLSRAWNNKWKKAD